jgi:hypothetical protein
MATIVRMDDSTGNDDWTVGAFSTELATAHVRSTDDALVVIA